MTRPPGHRVREIFDHATALDPDARAAYLDHACGEDAALRREVESLLSHIEHARDAGDIVKAAVESTASGPTRIGARVGAYTILERIGEGGMGTVWRAERADDAFRKRVALKIVRGGFDSPRLVERFRAERRILARLEHPGIARILDGGKTGDGLPFFVLEYVDGIAIDAYCRKHSLSTRKRLDLFLKVCEAVAYAHRNLVIHRDLKPANIMVTNDGDPKLLDFGIAKLTKDELEADLSVAGSRPMTPEYAAPEQIRAEPVTTATDVYALGLLLYELLTGSHPFRRRDAAIRDVERAVLEAEPEAPSRAIARVPADHGTAVPSRDLKVDLDNIVLRAIERDPARRYPTVPELADDIDRHLDGLPVHARPSTAGYRMHKFVRRHAAAVATAAGVGALLVVATTLSTIAFMRADRARAEAEVQRDTVQEINAFLRDMFGAASPVETQSNETLTVREVLDAAADRIGTDLADRPEVAASLHHAIGRSYHDLGLWEPAERALRSALDARRARGGLDTREGVEALTDLGVILKMQERYDEANDVLMEAIRRSPPVERGRVDAGVTARRRLADVFGKQGRYVEAESLYVELLATLNASPGGAALERAAAASDYGLLLIDRGRYADAEAHLRLALEGYRAARGEEHSDVARTWANLARVLNNLERPEDALESARRALSIHERIFPDDHVQVANTRVHIAEALGRLGRLDEADLEFERVLETYRRTYGSESGVVAVTVNNIALMYWVDAKDHGRALPLLREAAMLFAAVYGPSHPYTATGRHNVASLLETMGRVAPAEEECRLVLALRRRILDSDHTDIARSEILLGRLLLARRVSAEAEPLLRDAVRICAANLPAEHGLRAGAELQLGRCLAALSRLGEAEDHLLAARAGFEAGLGPDDRLTRETESELVRLYNVMGRHADANALTRRERGRDG